MMRYSAVRGTGDTRQAPAAPAPSRLPDQPSPLSLCSGYSPPLAPTFLGTVLHQSSHAVQGGVVFLLLAVGAATQVLLARFNSRRVVMAGLGLFRAVLAFSILLAILCVFSLAGIRKTLLVPEPPPAVKLEVMPGSSPGGSTG